MKHLAVSFALVVAPLSAFADCNSDFTALTHRNLSVGKYRMVLSFNVTEDGKSSWYKTDTKIQLPDSATIVRSDSSHGITKETIVAGGKGQRRTDGGKWEPLSNEATRSIFDAARDSGFTGSGLEDVSCQGIQGFGQEAKAIYSYTIKPDQVSHFQMKIFVDLETNLPALAEGMFQKSPDSRLNVKIEYFYGDDVRMEQLN